MNIVEKCSILSGVTSANNSVFIAVMNDGLAEQRRQHAIALSLKNETWSSIACEPVLPWLVAGITTIDQPSLQTVIVGWGGQVSVLDGDACHREGIQRKDSKDVSIVRSVAAIDNVVYAAGMRRQVHKRVGPNSWLEIDRNVAYEGDRIDVGFNTIGGFDRTEVYAGGLNGEIWRYDDRQWRQIQSPTNVHLHSMCCASDGSVYLGGRAGVLLRGRHDSWEILDIGVGETIWDLHWFLDKLYLVTNGGVFTYIDGQLEQVKSALLSYGDFLRFSSSRDRLWIFGRRRIARFDGLVWNKQSSDLSDAEISSPVFRFFTDDVLSLGSDYLEA